VHTRTDSPSEDVVAKQKAPGIALQSESEAQPGKHWSPAVSVTMQAFWSPRAFPPPAPSPTQSVEWTQAFVHHSPLQDSPGLQAMPPGLHGSPVPSWLQTGHLVSRHDVNWSRRLTPPPVDCVTQLLTHPGALEPEQVCSQFRRFQQSVFAMHAPKVVQQLASAHWVHWASSALIEHALELEPPSTAPPLPPLMAATGQLASSTSQTPSSGGWAGLVEHAEKATQASATVKGARGNRRTPSSKHPDDRSTPPPVGPSRPFVGNRAILAT
jgi:hypothetical protein